MQRYEKSGRYARKRVNKLAQYGIIQNKAVKGVYEDGKACIYQEKWLTLQ